MPSGHIRLHAINLFMVNIVNIIDPCITPVTIVNLTPSLKALKNLPTPFAIYTVAGKLKRNI